MGLLLANLFCAKSNKKGEHFYRINNILLGTATNFETMKRIKMLRLLFPQAIIASF